MVVTQANHCEVWYAQYPNFQFPMPKATFLESDICGKRTANCYIATHLIVIPNKRFYMLANERARITG